MKHQVIDTYIDPVVGLVKVFASKPTKHQSWMRNDTFYSAKMRISDDSCFTPLTRKAGKA